jgi:LysM repeat protein
MNAPPATKPKTARVPFQTGASNKVGVLNVYKTVELNSTGRHIVEFASFYPKAHEIYVTSGMDGDHGPRPNGSYHYGHLTFGGSPAAAIDFGALDHANGKGDVRMRDLARWFEDVIPGAAHIVELIHTTPFAIDQGFYVKDCQRIAGFDPATNAAHLNHVHLALSLKQVTAALARVSGTKPPVPSAPSSAVTHIVVSGDTLTTIAAEFNTTIPAILELNPSIKDRNVINVGDRIRVR